MSDMNVRDLLRNSRALFGRTQSSAAGRDSVGSFGLLALRLERDLPAQGKGRRILIVAADEDAIGVEATLELAWSLAEELGQTVLVVDGAFDAKALSTEVGLGNAPGLVELLDSPISGDTMPESRVHRTMHDRIAILPLGMDAGNRTINSEAMRDVLATASNHYDFVLVQASALIGGARSMAFSAFVDAALLVAVEEQTTMDQVARGQRLLNDCGANRVALVLTNRSRARDSNTF